MHIVLEYIVVNLQVVYYLLEALVLLFVPSEYRRKNVRGQVVLITGAGSGLGRLMADRFAKLGCKLVLWDINSESNEQTAEQVRNVGASAHTYTVDICKREDIYKAANKVKTEVGDVDILVNNAGIVTGKKILECPDAMMQKTMEVNAISHFWTVKAFLPAMLSRNRGHVVTIASGAGLFGMNGLGDYCASKFAAVGFDEAIRAEVLARRKTGVHTTVVCPYYIDTGMFEGAQTRFPGIMPIMQPDYVIDKIVDAVLTNQAVLCLPRFVYIMYALRNILPLKVTNVVADFMGMANCQDRFVGREKSS